MERGPNFCTAEERVAGPKARSETVGSRSNSIGQGAASPPPNRVTNSRRRTSKIGLSVPASSAQDEPVPRERLFQRVWPPMVIGAILVLEVIWLVLLVYLPIALLCGCISKTLRPPGYHEHSVLQSGLPHP